LVTVRNIEKGDGPSDDDDEVLDVNGQRGSEVQQRIQLRQTDNESDLLKEDVVWNSWGPWGKAMLRWATGDRRQATGEGQG
jgi:hypothetical protein